MQLNQEGKNLPSSCEKIVPMNIRMTNTIFVDNQRQIIMYEDEQITYLNVIARKQESYQQNTKGCVLINDDTGALLLTIPLRSEIDQNLFFKINSDENKNNYYNFILKARNYQNIVVFDVQAIQQVQQSILIICHIIQIGTQRMQAKAKKITHTPDQPERILNNSILHENIQETQKNEPKLSDKILNYIKISGYEGRTVKQLEYECYQLGLYNIQDLKKTLKNLTENKKIYQNSTKQGETFYIQNQ